MDIDIITARIKAYKAGRLSYTIFMNTILRAASEAENNRKVVALLNLYYSTKQLNNTFRGKPY